MEKQWKVLEEKWGIIMIAKEYIHKLIDELPDNKAGQLIDYILFLKSQEDQVLYMDSKEEEELWRLIENDDRMTSEQVKDKLLGE